MNELIAIMFAFICIWSIIALVLLAAAIAGLLDDIEKQNIRMPQP